MSFVTQEFINKLSTPDRTTVDGADFGVVQVDNEGTIVLYNKYEAELAGVEPSFAEGRNFFTQVAPCSNNRLFFGKFKDGVAKGAIDESFKYTFTYKMKPTPVDVRIYRDTTTSQNWLFVKKAA
jgi:photoactive yellow protein